MVFLRCSLMIMFKRDYGHVLTVETFCYFCTILSWRRDKNLHLSHKIFENVWQSTALSLTETSCGFFSALMFVKLMPLQLLWWTGLQPNIKNYCCSRNRRTVRQAALVFLPYPLCDFPHASVTFESKRPYCTPDTAKHRSHHTLKCTADWLTVPAESAHPIHWLSVWLKAQRSPWSQHYHNNMTM